MMAAKALGRATIISLVIAAAVPWGATPASALTSAPLTFCNKSPSLVSLSIGYFSPGVDDPKDKDILTGPFVSRGWWHLKPGACQSFENPFAVRYMFWFAVKTGFNTDYRSFELPVAAIDARKVHFCVTNYFADSWPQFNFEDENASMARCYPDKNNPLEAAGKPFQQQYYSKWKTLWVLPSKVDTWVDPTVNFDGYE